jgi:hypothetical protein
LWWIINTEIENKYIQRGREERGRLGKTGRGEGERMGIIEKRRGRYLCNSCLDIRFLRDTVALAPALSFSIFLFFGADFLFGMEMLFVVRRGR